MKRLSWEVLLGLFLITLSTFLYFIHYLIFKDAHHIIIYFLGDIAFVPIEVLLVTLIIHKLLSEREKRARLKKLNMVIGAFFSEVGTQLLKYFSVLDPRIEEIRKELIEIKDYFEIDLPALTSVLMIMTIKSKVTLKFWKIYRFFCQVKKISCWVCWKIQIY
jgi:vacuolar-type H+-ATPase subunit I/STV1